MSTRTLKLTSPAMRGSDVERFQADLNDELDRWDIDAQLEEDGVYGVMTRDMGQSVCYGLGLKSPVMEHGATPAIRLKVRHRKLSAVELARFREREEWRERLRRRLDGPGDLIGASVAFAVSMLGISESPPGSNRGPKIDEWQRACGVFAAPWCGCFMAACLVAAGFPTLEWLRYCPWIERRSRDGEGGWAWTTNPQVGDLVLYGASIAQHVGLVTEVQGGVDSATIEGNTGTGPGGSQSNGGIVAQRRRHQDGSLAGFPIRGFARPPWRQVERTP